MAVEEEIRMGLDSADSGHDEIVCISARLRWGIRCAFAVSEGMVVRDGVS